MTAVTAAGPTDLLEIVANQQGRHPNPNRTEFPITQQQRLGVLEISSGSGVDGDELRQSGPRQQRRQIRAGWNRLAFERSIRMGDRDVIDIGNSGKHHVVGIGLGLKNRPQSRIRTKRLVRLDALGDDVSRAMQDGVGEKLGTSTALFEPHLRKRRQMHEAQDHDDRHDDRRDAKNLLGLDPYPHAPLSPAAGRLPGVRCCVIAPSCEGGA